jgi:16S rRNA (cytosine967-C5)-methyltransferase
VGDVKSKMPSFGENVHRKKPPRKIHAAEKTISPRSAAPRSATSRGVALDILLRVERDKAYSNLLLDAELCAGKIDSRDAAFVTALVYGVLEKSICLDFFIAHYAKRGVRDIAPVVRSILRLGAYQLIFLDRVPASAAVGESVTLAKTRGETHAAGFVNAVLREIARNLSALPFPDEKRDRKRFLHIKYSCPQWLLTKWMKEYGEENTLGILRGLEERPASVLRVNTLKTTPEDLIAHLSAEGINVRGVDSVTASMLPGALESDRLPDLRRSPAFCGGLFTVQNTASQLCCLAAGAKPGDKVLDLCAAPGGKSFTLAFYMQNKGEILACELYQSRLRLIEEGAKRLSVDIVKTLKNDACVHNPALGEADIVLCDVPCSGLGVIGRKPEIRYKKPEEFDGLPDLQYAILCEGASHVKDGGTLVYSTCTLSRAENDNIVSRFLEEYKAFFPALPETLRGLAGVGTGVEGVTLFPHITHSDGFFIAVFKKSDAAHARDGKAAMA